jgi:predicted RNA binding protein YcfA (HicA-like mRNA interferase family)
VKYRDVARKLARLGCVEIPRRGDGSHRKWNNPAAGKATVVPDTQSKDLKVGTVRAVVRQLGIDWDLFQNS